MVIKPGEVRWLELELASNDIKLFCRNQPVKVHREGKKIQALIMESYFSDLTPFNCDFNQGRDTVARIAFKVLNREYKAEKLKVDPKKIKLSPEDQARADSEQVVLNKIYSSSLDRFQFSTSFKEPMTSLVTSLYGTKRVYNRQKKVNILELIIERRLEIKFPQRTLERLFMRVIYFTPVGRLSLTTV